MFAYVDESGNTGRNVFDKAQEHLGYIAFMTARDPECIQGFVDNVESIKSILKSEEIKGSRISDNQLRKSMGLIVKAIQVSGANIAISTVEKKFFLELEIMQQCLDPEDNKGTPLSFKHDRRIQMRVARELVSIAYHCGAQKLFWDAQMEKDEDKFYEGYANFCKILSEEIPRHKTSELMDPVAGIMKWNAENPKEATFFGDRIMRTHRSPNATAFSRLVLPMNEICKKKNHNSIHIVHDEQAEMQEIIEITNEIMSELDLSALSGVPRGLKSLGRNVKTEMEFRDSKKSIGLQFADLILSSFMRHRGLLGKKRDNDDVLIKRISHRIRHFRYDDKTAADTIKSSPYISVSA